MSKKNIKNTQDLESAMTELQGIVEQLEQKQLPLEKSLSLFEQGIRLTKECQIILKEAEQKVEILLNQNGQLEKTKFEAAEDQLTDEN